MSMTGGSRVEKATRIVLGVLAGVFTATLVTPMVVFAMLMVTVLTTVAVPLASISAALERIAGIDLTGPRGILRGRVDNGRSDKSIP